MYQEKSLAKDDKQTKKQNKIQIKKFGNSPASRQLVNE